MPSAAVVVSAADLESLKETLDITGGAALLADAKEAVMEIGTGAAVGSLERLHRRRARRADA